MQPYLLAKNLLIAIALLLVCNAVLSSQNPYQRTDLFYDLFHENSTLFGSYNGLPNADIKIVKINFDQEVCVLTDNGNIYTYRQRRFRIPPGIDPDIEIITFEVMPNKEILWFVDRAGVCYRYDQKRFSLLSFPRLSNTIGRIQFLNSLSDGRLFLANKKGDWFFLKQRSRGILPEIESIQFNNPTGFPNKLLEINSDIYVLMDSGVIQIFDSLGNIRKLESKNLPDSIVDISRGFHMNLLLVDKEGRLWSLGNSGEIEEIVFPHGCKNLNKINRIGEQIWLHCTEALMVFENDNNFNVCSAFLPVSPKLEYDIVENSESGFWIREPRYIWNIDEKVLMSVPNNMDFQLFIEDQNNPGEKLSISNGYELSLNEDYISIEIEPIDILTPIEPQYFYKLDDSDWQGGRIKNRTLLLKNLLPGSYQLSVKAVHPGGVEKTISGITLNIQSSFLANLSDWILWLMGAIILILLLGFIRIGIKKKIQSRNLKKTQEELKLLQLELKASRLQMNPHFLSNLLAVTEALIGSGEEEKASLYLIKGSKLMRSFLDSSRKEWVSLSEEIKWIKDYVALENLRSQKEIDFIFETSEDTDCEIPPLLIQPIVENSIYHGFKGRKNGKILLTSKFRGRYLQISIEDDGAGISKDKKSDKNSVHALGLIKERLTLLISNKKLDVLNLDVSNLGGVKVTIILPQRKSQF